MGPNNPMVSALAPTKVLVDPFGSVAPTIANRRWVWALLLFALSGALSAAVFASRWDARPATIAQLEQQEELEKTSEVQLEEQVVRAGRVKLTLGVLKAVVVGPLSLLLLAAFLKMVAWLFGKKAAFASTFSAVATATLPLTLYHLAFAASALRQPALGELAPRTLLPSNLAAAFPNVGPRAALALAGVDFFNLWSVGLLALGFASTAQLSRGRALALMLVLYAMYVGVFMIGLPALAGGGNGGGPR